MRCQGCGAYEDDNEALQWCEAGGYGTGHHFIEVDDAGMALPVVHVRIHTSWDSVEFEWDLPPISTFWSRLRSFTGP